MKYIDKCILCYIGIILITSILYIYFGTISNEPEIENFQEGLNFGKLVAPIKKKVDGIIKTVQKQFTSIKTKIDSVQNTITNKVDSVVDKIGDEVDNVKTSITDQVDNVKTSITDQVDNVKSTITDQVDNVKTSITDQVDNVKSTITDQVDNVKSTITDQVDTVEKSIKNVVSVVTKKVDSIAKKADSVLKTATRTLSKRARMMFDATEDFGDALKLEFENLGKAVKIGAEDVGQLFKIIIAKLFPYLKKFFGESVGSRAKCAWQKFLDIPHCSKYYIWDAFTSALYGLFILFPAGIIKHTTNMDVLKLVKKIQYGIACADKYIHTFLGFYILRWSDKIRDRCFRCTDLKPMPDFPTKDFKDHADKMKQTYKKEIPKLLKQPVGKFRESGLKFKSVFDSKAAYTVPEIIDDGIAFYDSVNVSDIQNQIVNAVS